MELLVMEKYLIEVQNNSKIFASFDFKTNGIVLEGKTTLFSNELFPKAYNLQQEPKWKKSSQ